MNFTAKDESDWLAMLEQLLEDESLRRKTGTLGKAYVEREFPEINLLARWDAVFESLGFCTKAQTAALL
jgi:hypothetical protein